MEAAAAAKVDLSQQVSMFSFFCASTPLHCPMAYPSNARWLTFFLKKIHTKTNSNRDSETAASIVHDKPLLLDEEPAAGDFEDPASPLLSSPECTPATQ